ncbi:TetR family transcriptional regulator [Nocardioides sp. Bht2]|uniref:TetR family transcriptional regulator n=1 Tax=Nocardioides sp. Bht2 TaxID=3392297 RepID=UPI0039B4AB2F
MTEHMGSTVRALRTQRGLSVRALAATLGLSPATISAIENDKVGVTVERLHALAAALEATVERLLQPAPRPTEPATTADEDWRSFATLELDPALDAALRLFVQHGFAATTMREIAATAGLSVAGIYHHYESKHRLLEAGLDLTMSELDWRVRAARDEGGTAAQQFARMVEALALFHAHRPDLAFIGASEMRSFHGDAAVRIRQQRNELQYLIDARAEAAIADGTFTTPNPRPALRAISTMCTSLPQWFRPDGELSTAQIAHEFARLSLGMLGARVPVAPWT